MNPPRPAASAATTALLKGCFLGSILLEPQRWNRDAGPELPLARWLGRIAAAGFDGIEIWEPHWTHASAGERELLRNSGLRFVVNSYASLSPADRSAREASTAAAAELRAEGIKFNFGNRSEQLEDEQHVARQWAETLPPGCHLLCEAHAGTLADTPDAAAALARGWDGARIAFIVHPFFVEDLQAWLTPLGECVRHLHIQLRAADHVHTFVSLTDRPKFVSARGRALASGWSGGTATIEFTRGIGSPHADTATLLANAQEDARLLRTLLGAAIVEGEESA